MYRYSMFSPSYLNARNSRAPQLTIGQVAGTLAMAPDKSLRPMVTGRSAGRTWWENGWSGRRT